MKEINTKNSTRDYIILIFSVFYGIVILIIAVAFFYAGKTTGAEEVYKGNTYLKYTVVNNEKVDSCIVFK